MDLMKIDTTNLVGSQATTLHQEEDTITILEIGSLTIKQLLQIMFLLEIIF